MEAFISDSESVYQSYRDLYYKSINLLTKVTQKVQKDVILNEAIGHRFECFVSNKIADKLRNLDIQQDPRCTKCHQHQWTPHNHIPQIETLLSLEALDLFKLKTDSLLRGWKLQHVNGHRQWRR